MHNIEHSVLAKEPKCAQFALNVTILASQPAKLPNTYAMIAVLAARTSMLTCILVVSLTVSTRSSNSSIMTSVNRKPTLQANPAEALSRPYRRQQLACSHNRQSAESGPAPYLSSSQLHHTCASAILTIVTNR